MIARMIQNFFSFMNLQSPFYILWVIKYGCNAYENFIFSHFLLTSSEIMPFMNKISESNFLFPCDSFGDELTSVCISWWYDLNNDTYYTRSADMHLMACIIKMVADVLAPNRCQAIISHHAGLTFVYNVPWIMSCKAYIELQPLTHWGRVTHICVSKLTIIGSDNGLSPSRRQAIIWTSDGILLIGPLGANFSEILIEIHTFSFKKIPFEMSSGKWQPFCLGLNVL